MSSFFLTLAWQGLRTTFFRGGRCGRLLTNFLKLYGEDNVRLSLEDDRKDEEYLGRPWGVVDPDHPATLSTQSQSETQQNQVSSRQALKGPHIN